MPFAQIPKLNKYLLTVLFIVSVHMLSGCWDSQDIEKRALVLGIGIDTVEDKHKEATEHFPHLGEEPQNELFRITAQIAVPGQLPLGITAGTATGGKESVWVLDAVGHTIDDAYQLLQQQISRDLFLGHLRIIVVEEKVARHRIMGHINDFFRRHTDVRRTVWMVVSKEKAAKHLEAMPKLDRIPTLYLVNTMETAVQTGRLPNQTLGRFWICASSHGTSAFLPYVSLMNKQNLKIEGLAYFRREKMIGTTEAIDIGMYLAVLGIGPGGYSILVEIPDENVNVMVRTIQRRSKIDVVIENERPKISIKYHVDTEVRERIGHNLDINNQDAIQKIENNFEETLEKATTELIQQMQKEQTDIFGFGEYVRAKQPQYWNKEIQSKENWLEMFEHIPIDVQVYMTIRRVGMESK